jgi:hypothetical protein
MNELSPVHTSCSECIFAQYHEKSQIGCNFPTDEGSRLSVFYKQNKVLDATNNKLNFAIINGRYCVAKRESHWGSQRPQETWVSTVQKELEQKVDILIPVQSHVDTLRLPETLRSLREQELAPHSLVVVNNQTDVPVETLHQTIQQMAGDLNWFTTTIAERTEENRPVSLGRALDIAIRNLRGHFYGFFFAGTVIPKNYVSTINRKVLNLEQFAVLISKFIPGHMTVALSFHRQVGGFQPTEIADDVLAKARHLAMVHETPWLVGELENLCV